MKKVAGVDGFGTTFVKGSSKGLMEPLVSLMKESLENAAVPDDWKKNDFIDQDPRSISTVHQV
jgi:hypothetical protein